jgi:hypothetical protein
MTSGTRNIELLDLETEEGRIESWQTLLRMAVPRYIAEHNLKNQANKYARPLQISASRNNSKRNTYSVTAEAQQLIWDKNTYEELVQDVIVLLTIARSPIGKSFRSILDVARTMTIVKAQLDEAIHDTLRLRVRKSYSTKFYQRFGTLLANKPFELMGEVDHESVGGSGYAYGVKTKCELLLLDKIKLNSAVRIFSTYEPEKDSGDDSQRVNMRREYRDETLVRALEDINETLEAALTVRFMGNVIQWSRPDLFPQLIGLATESQHEGGMDLADQDDLQEQNGLAFSDSETSSRLDGTKTIEGEPLQDEPLDRELDMKVDQSVNLIVSALTEKEKTVFVNYVVNTDKQLIAKQVGATTQNLSQVANRVNNKIKDICSTIFVEEEIKSSDLTEARLLVIRRLIPQLRPFLIFEELEVS